ncbi:hypothetical protein [Clostridium sp. JN-1]|jgi:hypothetical protein|nr:hypothetical protein [Clostridium sp. JN-1]
MFCYDFHNQGKSSMKKGKDEQTAINLFDTFKRLILERVHKTIDILDF